MQLHLRCQSFEHQQQLEHFRIQYVMIKCVMPVILLVLSNLLKKLPSGIKVAHILHQKSVNNK